MNKLKYYIVLGAPPIRDLADGNEPFMRPEVGFNPSWFHDKCGIDFSEKWHTDVKYRMQSHEKMSAEIKKRFPGYNIGRVMDNQPPDLITGIFGIGIMDSIFGRSLRYFTEKWPVPVGNNFTEVEIDKLKVPNLENNPFFQSVLKQVDEVYKLTGNVKGYLNWQGNLNTSFRFRGDSIFADLMLNVGLIKKLLNVISDTYIQGVKLFYEKQTEYGIENEFATIANCTVNMVGPEIYKNVLLEYDNKIAKEFEVFGIHNCAWTATPYLELYSSIPNVGYIDMGIETDLEKAKELFKDARRNCLYKSIDLKNKSQLEIRKDFEFIAENLGPCDVGLPDIENDVPDEKIMFAMDVCYDLSERF